jgi:broad specificity phosphatase PhoE
MTELILARHGETAWNVAEVFRGRSDVDLNETGLRQADLLADYLRERKIEAVYSSPLQRALKTARAIASHHGLEAIATEGLNDLKFGEWEGVQVTEVRKKYPALLAQWETTPHLVKIPGGETLDAVRQRATALVSEVIVQYKGTVVFVTHRVVTKLLILALLGLDNSHFWAIKHDTAAITTFTLERTGWCLVEHNNTCYLKPLEKPPLKDF